MFSYNGIEMELVSIDRFEREAVESQDGVDYLYNQYTIQVTAVVHSAYLNIGDPFQTNNVIKEILMQKRKKLKISFATGGVVANDNALGLPTAFGSTDASSNPFTYYGPIPSQIQQQDVVPDSFETHDHVNAIEEDVLIESPLGNAPMDAHLGPEPLFCNITKFLGENGFVITYAIRTWLNDCEGDQTFLPILSNRFVMVHNVDADQMTTITTYGTAIFQTDLLLRFESNPDAFRKQILAPIWKRFRRDFIQVKQMSDSSINYLTKDVETPVTFNPKAAGFPLGAVRCEIQHRRLLASQDSFASSLMNSANAYYNFKAQKNFADQNAERDVRMHDEQIAAAKAQAKAMTRLARAQANLAKAMAPIPPAKVK